MAYKITHGTDTGVLEQRRETATLRSNWLKSFKLRISQR